MEHVDLDPERLAEMRKADPPAYWEVGTIRAAAVADSRLIELTQLLPAES